MENMENWSIIVRYSHANCPSQCKSLGNNAYCTASDPSVPSPVNPPKTNRIRRTLVPIVDPIKPSWCSGSPPEPSWLASPVSQIC